MSDGIISAEYKALESILLEYVERYGLTPSARLFFEAQKIADAEKNIEVFPAAPRRTARA